MAAGFLVMIAAFVALTAGVSVIASFAAPPGTPLLRRILVGTAIGAGFVLLPLALILVPPLVLK
ncbi:hypothetical protein [Kitasatospora sp. NPDC002040]|uniref:hypothetical protein n=1 Tax=Kitasatospora sp. NPDC002040 TaxID=3154661 RepID=UPI0033165B7F